MKYSVQSLLNKPVKRLYVITISYRFKKLFNLLSLSFFYKNTENPDCKTALLFFFISVFQVYFKMKPNRNQPLFKLCFTLTMMLATKKGRKILSITSICLIIHEHPKMNITFKKICTIKLTGCGAFLLTIFCSLDFYTVDSHIFRQVSSNIENF